jgi:cell division septation protein DedD
VVSTITSAPPITRALGFDPDDGTLALIDDKGQPRRLDLRATEARIASRAKLSSLSTANGSDLYGITATGSISRITPTGDWSFEPPSPAKKVFPQRDGSVIIAGLRGGKTELWRIRPTDDEILATATLPADARNGTIVGDRLYFASDSGLVGVRTRDLTRVKTIPFSRPVRAIVPTPSGDRIYVALNDDDELSIIDRYSEEISGTVTLPSAPEDLRMDPLGQNLLVKPAGDDASVWVVSLGTDRVNGTVSGQWRNDLPAFAPGNRLAVARGGDVVFVDATDLSDRERVAGGAADYWYFATWNGFRPRSQDLDRPTTFEPQNDTTALDSASRAAGRDSAFQPTVRDGSPTMVEPPPGIAPRERVYMVSFAAVLTEQKANETAQGINVNGTRPRVVAAQSGSTTIYRVVLGPYASREEADKVGKESGRAFWIYEDIQ